MLSLMDQRVATLPFVPVDISVFRSCGSDSPRFAQGQSKGGSCKRRKGERKTYCIVYSYIHISSHISATDLLMPASARRASTRGFVDLQTNCAFRRRAKEKIVRTSERKRLLSK